MKNIEGADSRTQWDAFSKQEGEIRRGGEGHKTQDRRGKVYVSKRGFLGKKLTLIKGLFKKSVYTKRREGAFDSFRAFIESQITERNQVQVIMKTSGMERGQRLGTDKVKVALDEIDKFNNAPFASEKGIEKTLEAITKQTTKQIAEVPGLGNIDPFIGFSNKSDGKVNMSISYGGALEATLIYDPKEKELEIQGTKVGGAYQGKGILKGFMKGLLNVVLSKNGEGKISKMTLHANIGVGGYAWARYGFKPTEVTKEFKDKMINSFNELDWTKAKYNRGEGRKIPIPQDNVDDLKKQIRKRIDGEPDAVRTLADIPIEFGSLSVGKKLLLGSSWHGELNMDDKDALTRLKKYINYTE